MLCHFLHYEGIANHKAHDFRRVEPGLLTQNRKTPVLTSDQARALLDSIDTSTLVGLRDRALIGVMTYMCGRWARFWSWA
jgi:site-specific recombinase XerD